jgi:hypothetical protein
VSIEDLTTNRRGLFAVGGAAAGALVLAACGKKANTAGTASGTTTTTMRSQRDISLLKTAASIEELEAAVYQRALDSGILKSAGLADTVKTLLAQHKAHATLLEGETTKAGGTASTQPNAVLQQQYQSRIDAMTDEGAFLRLATDLAQQAAATYQSSVTSVDDGGLRVVLASVGGVESRHATLLGAKVNVQLPAGSFATTEKAVAPGTGI